MNNKITWMILWLSTFAIGLNAQNQRQRMLMNQDWKFAKGHAANPDQDFHYGQALSFSKINFLQEATMLQADQESRMRIPHTERFDDSAWESISLPHDWGMSLGFDQQQLKIKGYRKLGGRSPENSVGWYRKTFSIEAVKGCRYTLEFEGIFRDAQVWMNGIYLGRGESGYVPLVFDVTECLNYEKEAKNVITVRVDATQSELWSYEGAGIYRNVWLTRTAHVHVAQWGTFVTSQVDVAKKEATVQAEVEIANASAIDQSVQVTNTIIDQEGKAIASAEQRLQLSALENGTTRMSIPLKNIRLWSVASPYRYTLQTTVRVKGQVVDAYETRFGLRTLEFHPDKGFFLNGERIQLQGVCCHQDHAGVGIAVPDRLNHWRIAKLKEFGVNAYRSSHNPPTVSVLEACDSLGMLVMDELRVMSSSDEGLDQLRTIVRRDRNHPSIVIWSLGNEEPAIQGSEKGRMLAERMKQIQHKLDPTRPCTVAMNGSWGTGFSLAVDVQGSNYFKIGNLDEVHRQLPQLPCLLTEEASTLTTRGIYQTDESKDFHPSYDKDCPGWGCRAQEWLHYVDERPYIGGAFVWTGFDYGGEALGYYWPGIASNFGILDYCGFPKDAYWYYKAWWTDEPVLHVLPHWNGLGTDSVDVHVYTNLDEVELVLNGKSLGKRTVGKFDIPAWKVKYAPGKLVAKGIKDGKKWTETVVTTGKPIQLQLVSETGTTVKDGGNDIAILTVQTTDAKGRRVPTADNYVKLEVKNGRLLGVGNGNPSCHEPDVFALGEQAGRSLFSGYAQLIVAPDGSGQPMEVTASSDGLKPASIVIEVND